MASRLSKSKRLEYRTRAHQLDNISEGRKSPRRAEQTAAACVDIVGAHDYLICTFRGDA